MSERVKTEQRESVLLVPGHKVLIEIAWITIQSEAPVFLTRFFSHCSSIIPSMTGFAVLIIVTVLASVAVCLFFDCKHCNLEMVKKLKHVNIALIIVLGVYTAIMIMAWTTLASELAAQNIAPATAPEWLSLAQRIVYCFIIEGIVAVFLIYITHKGNKIYRDEYGSCKYRGAVDNGGYSR